METHQYFGGSDSGLWCHWVLDRCLRCKTIATPLTLVSIDHLLADGGWWWWERRSVAATVGGDTLCVIMAVAMALWLLNKRMAILVRKGRQRDWYCRGEFWRSPCFYQVFPLQSNLLIVPFSLPLLFLSTSPPVWVKDSNISTWRWVY